MAIAMLSTTDNPYDPFDDFDKWYSYDTYHGYNSSGLLARVSLTSRELSDDNVSYDIEQAIDEIIASDPLHVFIKVMR